MDNTNIEPHRKKAHAKLSTLGRKFFQLIEFDESEELVLEIRKHPFGLVLVELTGLLITLIIIGAAFFIANDMPSIVGEGVDTSSSNALVVSIGLVLGIFSIIGTEIAAILYRNNVIFITSEKIAQVLYTSIFNRKLSQLSIGDVQDVTVRQNGVFPRLLNYGTLVIETAGEQQNLIFTFVPVPYEASKTIVRAHEENMRRYGN
jgi:uncharacterized membrane protein YdbT with pleckstrin-like domain